MISNINHSHKPHAFSTIDNTSVILAWNDTKRSSNPNWVTEKLCSWWQRKDMYVSNIWESSEQTIRKDKEEKLKRKKSASSNELGYKTVTWAILFLLQVAYLRSYVKFITPVKTFTQNRLIFALRSSKNYHFAQKREHKSLSVCEWVNV